MAASSVTRSSISVVIPTRNRTASLETVLRALAVQERLPDEVLVVDASDSPLDAPSLASAHQGLRLSVVRSIPALCAQRNLGIGLASGSLVFLCDDDVEPPPNYLGRLAGYLEAHPEVGAASGWVYDPETGGNPRVFPSPSFRSLVFRFVFQMGFGGDVEATRAPAGLGPVLGWIRAWYRRRGNTWSLGGWPLTTQVHASEVRTTIWVLGAAVVRRSWLLASRYDERLDRLNAHAVGDNYGVALGFPGVQGVAVLTDLLIGHRRSPENRLDPLTTRRHRLFALHYFLRTSPRFSKANRAWLAWSLVGQSLLQLRSGQGRLAGVTLAALAAILTGRNPLLQSGAERAPQFTPHP